jgi:hypothetical protein
MGKLKMDRETPAYFKVRRALDAKFYVTRQEQAICTQEQAICTQAGSLLYFETERDVLEFLAEADIYDTLSN